MSEEDAIRTLEAIARKAQAESSLPEIAELLRTRERPARDDCAATEAWAKTSVAIWRVLRDAGRIEEEMHFAFVSWTIECQIHEARLGRGAYSSELADLQKRIDAVEVKLGLAPGEFWPLGEGPPEYHAAHAAQERALDALLVSTLRECGESDMAELLYRDPDAYRRRCERAQRLLRPLPEQLPERGDGLGSRGSL